MTSGQEGEKRGQAARDGRRVEGEAEGGQETQNLRARAEEPRRALNPATMPTVRERKAKPPAAPCWRAGNAAMIWARLGT